MFCVNSCINYAWKTRSRPDPAPGLGEVRGGRRGIGLRDALFLLAPPFALRSSRATAVRVTLPAAGVTEPSKGGISASALSGALCGGPYGHLIFGVPQSLGCMTGSRPPELPVTAEPPQRPCSPGHQREPRAAPVIVSLSARGPGSHVNTPSDRELSTSRDPLHPFFFYLIALTFKNLLLSIQCPCVPASPLLCGFL